MDIRTSSSKSNPIRWPVRYCDIFVRPQYRHELATMSSSFPTHLSSSYTVSNIPDQVSMQHTFVVVGAWTYLCISRRSLPCSLKQQCIAQSQLAAALQLLPGIPDIQQEISTICKCVSMSCRSQHLRLLPSLQNCSNRRYRIIAERVLQTNPFCSGPTCTKTMMHHLHSHKRRWYSSNQVSYNLGNRQGNDQRATMFVLDRFLVSSPNW